MTAKVELKPLSERMLTWASQTSEANAAHHVARYAHEVAALEQRVALLNSRPSSLLGIVPPKWTLMRIAYQSWQPRARRYLAVLERRRCVELTEVRGTGPTPEQAVQIAAEKAGRG